MNALVHAVDGRLRIRVQGIKKNREAAAAIEGSLRHVKGVHAVRANPLTGSVLISYDPWRISQAELLELFGVSYDETSEPEPPRNLEGVARRMTELVLPVVLEALCYYAFRRLIALPLRAL